MEGHKVKAMGPIWPYILLITFLSFFLSGSFDFHWHYSGPRVDKVNNRGYPKAIKILESRLDAKKIIAMNEL